MRLLTNCFRGLSNLCVEDRQHYGADVRKFWKRYGNRIDRENDSDEIKFILIRATVATQQQAYLRMWLKMRLDNAKRLFNQVMDQKD